ncbi:MAG: hypothetical protein K9N23_13405 [Akkermansiaceae bacterium]|nr:hypothetical protein [Akkermansiaceae bacterium]MCF7732681.1 hypothetical protein [Akkermansiaceae bacterium]
MKRSLFLFLATTLAFHASALAQTKVPSLINYQGYVSNSAGVPIGNGEPENRTVTFRFWKDASDTAAASRLYSESQTVTILNGDFSVLIGGGAAVDGETNTVATVAEVFANKEVFLGITVDDGSPATTDAEISPRQQLVSTAFAFRASVAEGVDNGAISNAMLDANAVNTDQLVTSSVTNDKMAPSSVTSANIVDGTITSADIGTDAVGADEIAENAVGPSEIAANAVDTSELKDGSITTIDIANDAVTAAKIAADAVGASEIASGGVGADEIATGAVGTSEIADGSITGNDLATGTITAAKIAPNAVGTSELADSSVTASKLGANTMQSLESLRIIRGVVDGLGRTVSGVGFTVTRIQIGIYLLDFTLDFSGTPTLSIPNVVNGLQSAAFAVNTGFVTPDVSTNSRIMVYTYAGTTLADLGFTFTAVGPR